MGPEWPLLLPTHHYCSECCWFCFHVDIPLGASSVITSYFLTGETKCPTRSHLRASKVASVGEGASAQPEDLRLMPGIQMVEGEKSQSCTHMNAYARSCTHLSVMKTILKKQF